MPDQPDTATSTPTCPGKGSGVVTAPESPGQVWLSACCWRCTPSYPFLLLCPECGNKRCPRANDHDNACTASNELGQAGSAYA